MAPFAFLLGWSGAFAIVCATEGRWVNAGVELVIFGLVAGLMILMRKEAA